MLARQALYHLSHTSSPSCSGYFGDRVLFFCPGQPGQGSSYFRLPRSGWDDRHVTPRPVFFPVEMRSYELFS
jgi:hypothetical protein